MRLRETAGEWLAQGTEAVIVEVASTRGSVPREAGTRMLVGAHGTAGSIGGGHLEWQAIAQARALLQDIQPSQPVLVDYPLGATLGQCCGGAVTLRFLPLSPAQLALWPAPAPMLHLQLFGAGHVGRAVATLLVPLNVSVDWIDAREEEFPARLGGGAAWPAHLRKVVSELPHEEVRDAPPGAFYLVMTHQHALDLRITEAILRREDFAFLGVIGSRTKQRRFVQQLAARGIAPPMLERMTCPIGLAGIPGKEPEVIALSAVAQLLSVRGALRP